MPKNRIFPAVAFALLVPLVAWAQSPPGSAREPAPSTARDAATPPPDTAQAAKAATVVEPPTDAEIYLDSAIKKINALKTVSADIAETVDMLDVQFKISGRYRKGRGQRIYLQLKVAGLPDAGGETLQVCDGKVLWDYQQVLDSRSYRRIEIEQVFERLKAPELDESMRQQVITNLGFSGPDELLKGLRKSVHFNQPKVAETINGKEFWVLRGEWVNREGLSGPNQPPIPLTASLPSYVPSMVHVYLGQKDDWPYKVSLIGKQPTILIDTRPIGPDGQRIGSKASIQKVKATRIDLTYDNVKLDPDLADDEFVFTVPSNVRPEDQTQAVVSMLDQAIALRAAQKKAEAAKAEDPLLKESIAVPRADGPAAPAAPAPLTTPARK